MSATKKTPQNDGKVVKRTRTIQKKTLKHLVADD